MSTSRTQKTIGRRSVVGGKVALSGGIDVMEMRLKQPTGRDIRRIVVEQAMRAHVGHIGSALSVADIMAMLYGQALRISAPDDPERDRFVLSKGHAALALYAVLFMKGWVSIEELESYCGDGTLLGVHPEYPLRGVDFATGSLGHGLTMATGAALAARLQHSTRHVFCLMSDAECNEGVVWEAVMFANHHKLSNLIAIVDLNGQQALGYTDRVLSLSPMRERWQAFGWNVYDVDGHSVSDMNRIVEKLDFSTGSPHVLIAHTVFGKGVSFMERQIKWHYLPMSTKEYRQAVEEIETIA
jgi:transketolase